MGYDLGRRRILMRKLTALLFMFMSALGLSLLFTQQVFAVPETVTVKQAYLLDGENQTQLPEQPVTPGSTFEPATDPGEGYKFAYYIVNGLISDKAEGETFVVGSYLNLVAVYTPAGKFAVVFVDVNGEIIQHNNKLAQYVSSGEDAVAPTVLPTKKNYKVSETDPWSDSFDNVTENKVITLQYELDTDAVFTISLNGVDQTANYNDIVTLTADNDVLWKEDDLVVWYGSTYRFSALSDRALTTEAGSAPTEPIVSMQEILDLRAGHRSYLAQVYAPNNDLLEVGFLRGSEHEVTFDNMLANFASVLIPFTNEFIVSVPNSVEDNIRAYALSGDPLLASYSYVEPVTELIKLVTPVEPMVISSVNQFKYHVAIGPYKGAGSPAVGYSGKMEIIFINNDTLEESYYEFDAPANAGIAVIIDDFVENNLVFGQYTLSYRALGDEVTHTHSDWFGSVTLSVEPKDIDKPVLTIDENGQLNWNIISNVKSYNVTVNGIDYVDVTSPFDLTNLDLEPGQYTVKVTAFGNEGFKNSEAIINYIVKADVIKELSTPTNLTETDGILTWDSVPNAIGYIVHLDGDTKETTDTEFDLSLFFKAGTFDVTVVAKGDGVNYLNSIHSNAIEVTIEVFVTKLNSLTASDLQGEGGGLVNTHGSNDHRNIVWHAYVKADLDGALNQNGNAQGIRITVYAADGVTYLGETLVTTSGTKWYILGSGFGALLQSGNIVHLQVAPSEQGITNGYTYSDPLIYTLKG